MRVLDPALFKDVLLIDWDRNLGGDFRPVYTAALTGLGLSFDVFDGGTLTAGNPGPTFQQLQNYRAVVFFTGNNLTSWANAHVGGSFPLQDYLVAGGRIVFTGQDLELAARVQPERRQRPSVRHDGRVADGGDARSAACVHDSRPAIATSTGRPLRPTRPRRCWRRRSRCSAAPLT